MASGNDSRIKGRTHGRTDHQVHTLTKPLANGEPSTHGRERGAAFLMSFGAQAWIS